MSNQRILIAGANSGAGKTTVTLGLMAALQNRGLRVQGFKVGPDYIDPSYHTAVTGRPSRNLDTWMMDQTIVREVFERGCSGADIAVIEGVMGMYDGKDPTSNVGSTAEVSALLRAPVLLVVNAAGMARSAAAVVLGFQQMDPHVQIAGVIVNRVGSKGHYELLKTAIEQVCRVPVVGYLTKRDDMAIPERHLGLLPALERGEMQPLFTALGAHFSETVDLAAILQLATNGGAWQSTPATLFGAEPKPPTVTLAVAKDSAFNFYYPENLELLRLAGAKIRYFSPLAGEKVPMDADGLYIGGGFPEEFAAALSAQRGVIESVQQAAAAGMPIFAECGGFMFLTEELTDRNGGAYPMAGIIPAKVTMQKRLAALGYREVRASGEHLLLHAGETARGHEFHYSTVTFADTDWPYAYETASRRGVQKEGYARQNVLAGYTHLHFASHPQLAARFVAACANFQARRRPPLGISPEC